MKADPLISLIVEKLTGEKKEWHSSARTFPIVVNDFIAFSGLSIKFSKSELFGRIDMTHRVQNKEFYCDYVPGAY